MPFRAWATNRLRVSSGADDGSDTGQVDVAYLLRSEVYPFNQGSAIYPLLARVPTLYSGRINQVLPGLAPKPRFLS